MKELHIKTDRFNAAMEKYLEGSRRSTEAVMQIQAKGIVKEIISITPPGRDGVGQSKARQAGERSVTRDILAHVKGVREGREEQSDAASYLEAKRYHGRLSGRTTPRVKVNAAQLRAHLKLKKSHVGRLAAGWSTAATGLGVRPPSWVARHSSPGAFTIKANERGIRIKMTNRVHWASEITTLEQRIQRALNKQTNKIERQLRYAMENAANRSGLRRAT